MLNFATADPYELETEAVRLMEELMGRKIARADPLRIFLKGLINIIMQQRLLIDETAKMNLLAYSKGEYLERLGDLVGVKRLEATSAVTTAEVEISALREQATIIRAGTRFTADDEIYFALDQDVIFAAGEKIKMMSATCLEKGAAGNGYAAGELNKIVDPQAFLLSIKNATVTEGGSDEEDDESLRARIREAPESFSTAGSIGAYKFHAKSASALISDVGVGSSEPGKVEVYILLQNGEIPGAEMLNAVYEHLSADKIRPLTDYVRVLPPETEEFDLNVRYWLSRSDMIQAATIISSAEKAVEEYISWQQSRLGLDINPDELIKLLKNAGVKRVEIASPSFKVLGKFTVAKLRNKTVTFAGLEDD